MRTLRRRYPLAELLFAGVTVEGERAPAALVEGIERVSAEGAEVVLLVRGGGSYEDLMPFNAEIVARAVAACPVPVVTGIGHEPDTSIADMVADLRASTPTAAAEAVTPSHEQLTLTIARERRALAAALQNRLRTAVSQVTRLAERPVLRDPNAVLGPVAQAIDIARMRLSRALPERLARDGQRVEYLRGRLRRSGPALLDHSASAMALAAARLEDLSPLGILSRGYAVCFAEDGSTVVKHVGDLNTGDTVVVRVSDGRIGASVTTLMPLEER